MESGKIFKTKTGFCHVLSDRIILSRHGIVGDMANVAVGKSVSRILLIYTIIPVWLLYLAYNFYSKGELIGSAVMGFVALYFLFGIIKSLKNSAAPIIERNKIKEVTFKKAIWGLTRAYFIVRFEDEKGKIKNRLIMLPGSASNGPEETEKALRIMREEKLLY